MDVVNAMDRDIIQLYFEEKLKGDDIVKIIG